MHYLIIGAFFVFLQTATGAATSAKCPEPHEVEPCVCSTEGLEVENVDILLHCVDDSTTLHHIKRALIALKSQGSIRVQLYNNQLGTIPFDFFKGLLIKEMYIENCGIDSLSGGGELPLEGLENTLEELTFIDTLSASNGLLKLSFGHLNNLKELDLTGNPIDELGDDWFRNASKSLRTLTFYGSDFQTIGQRAFADVTNLESIMLEQNRFGSITRSMFPNPANKLEVLQLSDNALTSLPEDIFTNMPNLKKVTLTSNGLTKMPENTWRNVWNTLHSVDLYDNSLICDSHMNWMTQVPTCAEVDGKCGSPIEKRKLFIPVLQSKNCAKDSKEIINELKNCINDCFVKHQ